VGHADPPCRSEIIGWKRLHIAQRKIILLICIVFKGFFKFFLENNACKNKGKGGEMGGYMRERTMLQHPMHFAPKIPFLAICKGPC
jgi:hypothetical protein